MGFVNSISNVGPLPPGGDPDAFAQKYADEHGITLEEAKEELRSKYGDPQQPTQPSIYMEPRAQIYTDSGEPLYSNPYSAMGLDINFDSTSEADYAEVNQDDPKTDALKRAGIPEAVIKQGDDAVRKYAEEHGIKLPPPPQRPPQGPQRPPSSSEQVV